VRSSARVHALRGERTLASEAALIMREVILYEAHHAA